MADIKWNERFQTILEAGESRLGKVFTPNATRYTVALLRLLKQGKSPTPQEVVNYVYSNMASPNGWVTFDHNRWLTYHGGVVAALKSDKPHEAFDVLSKR